MRDIKLVLAPFLMTTVTSCKIEKAMCQHSKLVLTGHIDVDQEKIYQNLSLQDTEVCLTAIDENNESINLFCGVVLNLQIQVDGNLRLMTVTAISSSYRMDLVRRTRVFQNPSMQYATILKYLDKDYPQSSHLMSVNDMSTGGIIVQYNETDWAFINRLATHFSSVVVPVYNRSGTNYYFGTPLGVSRALDAKGSYTVKKESRTFLTQMQNSPLMETETDSMAIVLESREAYELGDTVHFQSTPYVVASIDSELVGRELLHRYTLRTATSIKTGKIYNMGIIGASLEANIIGVAKDIVKVNIFADGLQENAKWFPYSTVYSSPDGTGWYCMPEEGDSVRLYFPSEREDEGYIISAVHMPSSGSDGARSNPDNKSLKSKYGKEVLFTPGTLIMTNNKGMSVEILDDEGVKIISDKAVVIESKASVQIASTEQSVSVVAPQAITLMQGETSLTIQDQIHLDGAQVHLE